MADVLLDTDIFSELLKCVDQLVVRRAQQHAHSGGSYLISAITVMEIVKGLQKKSQPDRIKQFLHGLETIRVIGFDGESAVLAGRIAADLEASGQTIGRADPMVAAIAIHHNLTLVTGNTGHFRRITQLGYPLALDNWRS